MAYPNEAVYLTSFSHCVYYGTDVVMVAYLQSVFATKEGYSLRHWIVIIRAGTNMLALVIERSS